MADRYSENLFEAMDLLIKKRLDALQFDNTIEATIVNIDKAANRIYLVKYGDAIFEAIANSEEIYKINDCVLVTIPQNDFNKQKIIIGLKKNEDAASALGITDYVIDITGNLAPDGLHAGLVANDPEDVEPGTSIQKVLLETIDGITTKRGPYLQIEADFRTLIPAAMTGNYGLLVEAFDSNGTQLFSSLLDSSKFFGNPYNFQTYFKQSIVLNLSNFNNSVNKLKVYAYQCGNFKDKNGNLLPYQIEDSFGDFQKVDPNIFVDNINIFAGYLEEKLDGDMVEIYCDEPIYYGPGDTTRNFQLRYISKAGAHYQAIETKDNFTDVFWYRWNKDYQSTTDPYFSEGWQRILDADDFHLEITDLNTLILEEKFRVVLKRTIPTQGGLSEDSQILYSNILTFENKADIQSLYTIDLDDDFTSLITDENGNFESFETIIRARLLKGTQVLTVDKWSIDFSGDGSEGDSKILKIERLASENERYRFKVSSTGTKWPGTNAQKLAVLNVEAKIQDQTVDTTPYKVQKVATGKPGSIYSLTNYFPILSKDKNGAISPITADYIMYEKNGSTLTLTNVYWQYRFISTGTESWTTRSGAHNKITFGATGIAYPTNDFNSLQIRVSLTNTFTDSTILDEVNVEVVKDGIDGNSINSITELYKATNSTTPPEKPTSSTESQWSTTVPTLSKNAKYLWNSEKIIYTKSATTYTDPAMIGSYSEDGRGIVSITEYYAINNNPDTAPSSWSESVVKPTAANPYLWNKETITYNKAPITETTTPAVIGHFGKDGESNYSLSLDNDFKSVIVASGETTTLSISGINASLFYGATAVSEWKLSKGSGDHLTITNIGTESKKSFDIETIGSHKFGKGSYSIILNATVGSNVVAQVPFEFSVIENGKDGEAGTGISSIGYKYLKNNNGATPPSPNDSNWKDNLTDVLPLTENAKYLWQKETIKFSKGNDKVTVLLLATLGDAGNGISSTTIKYCIWNSGTSHPADTASDWKTTPPETTSSYPYLWTQTKLTYTDTSIKYIYSVAKTGLDSITIDLYPDQQYLKIGNTPYAISGSAKITEGNKTPKAATGYTVSLFRNGTQKSSTTLTSTGTYNFNNATFFTDLTETDVFVVELSKTIDGSKVIYDKETINTLKDGEDGISVQSVTELYRRTTTTNVPAGPETEPSNWSTTIPQVDKNNPYLWNVEKTTYSNGNVEYTAPAMIGNYAKDGKGISSITEYYNINNSSTTAPTSWVTTFIAPTKDKPYLWNYEEITYTDSSKHSTVAQIIGHFGKDGSAGYNTATIYLYKRGTTTPAGPTGTATYKFSDKTLTWSSGGDNDWKQKISDTTGSGDVYIIAAVATATSATDTIASNEWSSAVPIGKDGQSAYNNASVFLYKRSASTPSKPTNTLRYDFTQGKITTASSQWGGWSDIIPASDGNPCYSIHAMAVSLNTYDDILSSEWSTPTIYTKDGEKGNPGEPGESGKDGKDGSPNAGFNLLTFGNITYNLQPYISCDQVYKYQQKVGRKNGPTSTIATTGIKIKNQHDTENSGETIDFKDQQEYVLSFNFQRIVSTNVGHLTTIGGHSESFRTTKIIIDDKDPIEDKQWGNGVDVDDDTALHSCKVYLIYDETISSGNRNLYIQPQRKGAHETNDILIEYSNLQLEEGDTFHAGLLPRDTSVKMYRLDEDEVSPKYTLGNVPAGSSAAIPRGYTLTKPDTNADYPYLYQFNGSFRRNSNNTAFEYAWEHGNLIECFDKSDAYTKEYWTLLTLTANEDDNGSGLYHDPGKGKLYINASFLKTGTILVGNAGSPIFSASINNPTVELAGWTATPTEFYNKVVSGTNYYAGLSIQDQEITGVRFFAGAYTGDSTRSLDLEAINSAPFRVQQNGKLYATNAEIEGKITATDGEIGEWTINTSSITAENGTNYVGMIKPSANNTRVFFAGGINSTGASAPFYVQTDGKLVATEADISGKITSISGSIGGWTLSQYAIANNTKAVTSTVGIYQGESYYVNNSYIRFWAGATPDKEWEKGELPFAVTEDGSLYASKATIADGFMVNGSGSFTGLLKTNRIQGFSSSSFIEFGDRTGGFRLGASSILTKTFYIKLTHATTSSHSTKITATAYEDSEYKTKFKVNTNYNFPIITNIRSRGNITIETGTSSGNLIVNSTNMKMTPCFVENGSTLTTREYEADGLAVNMSETHLAPVLDYSMEPFNLGIDRYRWDTVNCRTVNQTSDRNLKDNISPMLNEYDILFDQLQPVRFKYKQNTNNRYHTGFVAQDVEQAIYKANLSSQDIGLFTNSSINTPDQPSTYGLYYNEFIALNTWQIQKLKSRVFELEQRIAELESKL